MVDRPVRLGLRQRAPVAVVDRHVEAARPLGERLADAAHAEDAEHFAVEAPSEHEGRDEARPSPVADELLALGRAAGSAEDQQHGDLGGRDRDAVRRVADAQAPGTRRLEIDVVEADGEGRDDLEALRQALDDAAREFVGHANEGAVGIRRGRPASSAGEY